MNKIIKIEFSNKSLISKRKRIFKTRFEHYQISKIQLEIMLKNGNLYLVNQDAITELSDINIQENGLSITVHNKKAMEHLYRHEDHVPHIPPCDNSNNELDPLYFLYEPEKNNKN